MRRLIMKPDGWLCTLKACRPGHFLFDDHYLGFKSEYHTDKGKIEAYNEAGEFFCPPEPRDDFIVQPVDPVWENYEE